LFFLASTSIC